MDGRLDDPAWKLARDAGPLLQVFPDEEGEPSERTEFRIVYDDDNLYFGFSCFERDPSVIVAREMVRDGRVSSDDYITIVLDTFLDRRNGYQFRVNPNGAREDSLISANVNLNDDWNGIWTVRTTVDDEGWKAEVAIPFKTLAFDPKLTRWGLNISRNLKRRFERNRWSEAKKHLSTYNVAEAGYLTGLEGIEQGIGLELRPYVLGRFGQDRILSDSDTMLDVGGDIRYRITPNLSASLSYNTDFAETEVDARQVNLTRFPLFFPEKRAFFLEDSGVFRFGGVGSSLIPFFSRRMGLSSSGEMVPLVVAGKLTGRIGDYNIGLIDALVDENDGLDMKNTFVGRVSRNVFEQSAVGAILTHGDPNSDNENTLVGGDFAFRTSELPGDSVVYGNAFALGTFTEGLPGRDNGAFGANAEMRQNELRAELGFYQIEENFNPALGFAPRKDIRAYEGEVSYRPEPRSLELVRRLYFTYSSTHITDLDNELDTASHSLFPLYILFESQDELYCRVRGNFDSPDEDFEISEGVVIPPDEYWWPSYQVGFETASKRPLEMEFSYSFGEFYDGRRETYSVELDIKPARWAWLRLDYLLNDIRLPQGEFETRLASARLRLSFTPDLAWHNFVQYDNVSDTIGYQSRVQWEFRPGSFVYVVFNQNVDRTDHNLKVLENEVTAKIGMTFRF